MQMGFLLAPKLQNCTQVPHELDWPFAIRFAQIVSSPCPIALPKAVQCNNDQLWFRNNKSWCRNVFFYASKVSHGS